MGFWSTRGVEGGSAFRPEPSSGPAFPTLTPPPPPPLPSPSACFRSHILYFFFCSLSFCAKDSSRHEYVGVAPHPSLPPPPLLRASFPLLPPHPLQFLLPGEARLLTNTPPISTQPPPLLFLVFSGQAAPMELPRGWSKSCSQHSGRDAAPPHYLGRAPGPT